MFVRPSGINFILSRGRWLDIAALQPNYSGRKLSLHMPWFIASLGHAYINIATNHGRPSLGFYFHRSAARFHGISSTILNDVFSSVKVARLIYNPRGLGERLYNFAVSNVPADGLTTLDVRIYNQARVIISPEASEQRHPHNWPVKTWRQTTTSLHA